MKNTIGVTGGIGSGKSTVLQILHERYGFAVFRTDEIAKELMQPGQKCLGRLRDAFGTRILNSDGTLNKKCYGDLIYGNRELLKLSDSIVHPAVWEAVGMQLSECRKNGVRAVIETALPNRQFYEFCGCVWYVHAEKEVQIERLMCSRGLDRVRCEEIIASQQDEENYREQADAVIENSGTLSETERRVADLLQAENGGTLSETERRVADLLRTENDSCPLND